MTNLLVQSVDTIHFYRFLSTEHNCVQITPSQGNSHKILLSIKINVIFCFWENKREIGKAMQEKRNLGQTLLFGQFWLHGHCDGEAVIRPNLTASYASDLFPSFPLHPIEPKHFCALFQKSSGSGANCGSWAVCQQQGWQKPWGERATLCRAQGQSGSGAVRLRWGRSPVPSVWLPLLLDFRGHIPKNLEYSPLGRWQLWVISFSLQAGPSLPVEGKTLNCSMLCSSRKSFHLRHSFPRQNANSAAGTCHIFQD